MTKSKSKKKNALTINKNNLNSGILVQTHEIIHNSNFWHKFVISNTNYSDRLTILSLMVKHVYPLDLVPVNYNQAFDGGTFLARNCGEAIEQFCKDKLVVPNPENPKQPFEIQIVLKYMSLLEFKVDVQVNVLEVLKKQLDETTGVLNLTEFHKQPDLTEFCPLFQPRIMYFVLHLSKKLNFNKLLLNKNDLRSLSSLDVIEGLNLTLLDLSDNFIIDPIELNILKQYPNLKEIKLRGNPFCQQYDPFSYIQMVKEVCPKVEILDDIQIYEDGFPKFQKNFVCQLSGLDLVNQFLDCFFNIYDSDNRQGLEGLYHKQAMFSLTTRFQAFQISSANAQLQHYKSFERIGNVNLYKGPSQIMQIYSYLPVTEHDPYSFKCDLIYYTRKCAVINVTGVFRDVPNNILDPERILGFSRTFVLECISAEYCIVNEQWHVYNALDTQLRDAFKIFKPVRSNLLSQPKNAKQEGEVLDTMEFITHLKRTPAISLLKRNQYDLKNTLIHFLEMYKCDRIPEGSFE